MNYFIKTVQNIIRRNIMIIKDIMSKNIITCEPDDNILFVSNLMNIWDIGFIVIVDKNKLYGVVTDRDLVCDMANQLSTIKNYAHTNVVTIAEKKSIESALELMKKHKIKRLVITNHDKITGVLSLSDLLNSNVNEKLLLNTIKEIFAINRNQNNFNSHVHDFPL